MFNIYRKGIILAGGYGTRLYPITRAVSKQLLPVYDKPMIYYALTSLMLASIREILIITTPDSSDLYKNLLGSGEKFGIQIDYAIQKTPDGLADAFLIAEKFVANHHSALILGDNLFHVENFSRKMDNACNQKQGCSIFVYRVSDPERYGIVELDSNNKITNIVEKPSKPKNNMAVTGLYFYDATVLERVKQLSVSPRGELEITDLNKSYLKEDQLNYQLLSRGSVWLDTGTVDSLHEASSYIRTIEKRQGLKVGCPEEIAWRLGWIDDNKLEYLASNISNSGYGNYLLSLLS